MDIAALEDGKYTGSSGQKHNCTALCKNCVGGTEDECVECVDTAERRD